MKIFSMIFVCANSRAVHLNVVQNKGLESIFQCLTRFISLYGIPEKIWSDNEKIVAEPNRWEVLSLPFDHNNDLIVVALLYSTKEYR
ncbi:hypothetical protein DERF_002444 [Dermatophagoides farinae]|uniref:Integrase catalytic domain-containing protein n=1 Tax=Dermatophagoides farinae TaxID=6954 RepID=A0A922IAN8_DERFA|nr:hypothetical protein DERF_002444 [Dermatophagoides farinae]